MERVIDQRMVVVSAIVLGTVGVLSFIVQPGLVQGYVESLNVDEATANYLAFVEMLGIAVASAGFAIVSNKVSWRLGLVLSLILCVLGNVLSAFLPIGSGFELARLTAGLGHGGVICISFGLLGVSKNVEKNVALYLVALLTYGAVGLWAVPHILGNFTLDSVFIIWGVISFLAFGFVRFIPSHPSKAEGDGASVQPASVWLLISVFAGIFIYNTAIGLAWANMFLIGLDILPDEGAVANVLLLSQFAAILGALSAIWFANGWSRLLLFGVGILGAALFLGAMMFQFGFLVFAVSVCAFNFLWNWVLPFIMGSVSGLRSSGSMVAYAVATQMAGLAFGPFLASLVLGAQQGYGAVIGMSVLLMVISFFAISIAEIRRAAR